MTHRGAKTELTGREKAAMLLIALGPEKSAEIFKYLKEEEIEQLTLEIANIRTVSPEQKESFGGILSNLPCSEYIAEGGIIMQKKYLKRLFEHKRRWMC